MHISNIELVRFKKLLVPNIRRFEAKIDSRLQVIIGSNGSGKTSILLELLPTAPTKTLFEVDGYKRLEVEHLNDIYELTYSPEDGHRFKKNGDNLNGSGIRNIQVELIKKHFKLDTDINLILQGSLPIVEMRPSQRQTTFISLNPMDISIFVDEKSRIRKLVNSSSSCLDMLYKRQEAIAIKLLPKEEFTKVCESVDRLNNEEKTLLIWMTKVSTALESIGTLDGELKRLDIEELMCSAKRCARALYQLSDIDKSRAQETSFKLEQRIQDLKKDINTQSDAISTTVSKIDNTRAKLEKIKQNDHCNDTIVQLKKSLSEVTEPDTRLTYVDKDELAAMRLAVLDIERLLDSFMDLESCRLMSDEEYTELTGKCSTVSNQISTYVSELHHVEIRVDEVYGQIRDYRISDNCSKDDCELYTTYYTQMEEKKKLHTSLIADKSSISKLLSECRELYGSLNESLTEQTHMKKIVTSVENVLVGHPSLLNVVKLAQLTVSINNSIPAFIGKMKSYLDSNNDYLIRRSLLKELAELEAKESGDKQAEDVSISFLTDALKLLLEQRTEMKERYHKVQDEYTAIQIEQERTQLSINKLVELKGYQDQATTYLESSEKYEGKKYLTRLYSSLADIMKKVRSELVSGNEFIQEQTSLLSRMDNEIVANINVIKGELTSYRAVEKSLLELSHMYTKTFLNNLITSANGFIEEIINYPVVIQPITDENITFIFPVLINDSVKVKDIGECSDAQKVIINLALNLALIVELELTDYPIFLDEMDRSLDPTVRENLYTLLINLLEQGVVSQMFIINHHIDFIDSQFCDTIVLDATNLKLAKTQLTKQLNVNIEKYNS